MGVPISSLPAADALTGAEQFPVVQNGITKRTALNASGVLYDPAGTGAVATTVQAKLRETVSVKDFGADPAASAAVNTAAIQAAADYANSIGAKLIGAPGTFTVNTTISLNCNGDLGNMTIEADGSVVSPIVRFGTTAGTPTSRKIITLPRVRNNARAVGTWGAGVGIELANCNNNIIVVPSATECEIGLLCGGYNSGFAYNNMTLMNVYSNKINLKLTTLGSTGWCNQNTFIGGRLGANTADFTTSGYTGTRQILLSKGDTSSGGPNTNTFLGTSIETDNYEYMVEFNQSASANQFITCRYEGTNQKVLFATNISSGVTTNSFIGGYQVEFLQFTYSGTGSSAYNGIISPRRTDISGTGVTLNLTNGGGATVASPHIQGFAADKSALGQSASATDWRYRLYADGLSFKEAAESYDKVTIYSGQTGNPSILLGQGLAAPDRGLSLVGTGALVLETPTTSGAVRNNVDGQTTLGSATYRWSYVHAFNVRTHSVTVATLPAAATAGAGTRAFVTDATATTFAEIVAGGGANAVPVYSDGTNWRIG